LIQEDHYQILGTINEVCKCHKDLTEDTKFMLEILRSTNTIENAINRISKKMDLMLKVFSRINKSSSEIDEFAISFLKNLQPENIKS
jgi:hypothetical protein